MRIVVTGGLGFIGSHLARSLLRTKAHELLIIDNLHRPCNSDPTFGNEAEFKRIDIRDCAALGVALKGAEIVFHLARNLTSWAPLQM
jgi:dTDP-L-rhamnose 4-epimerase